jgi:hypothetical protein
MVEFIDLSDWKTKKQILLELGNVSEREWRKAVEKHNIAYCKHEVDTYIVHSKLGYKLTQDKQEIIDSIKDNKKRSLNMLWKYSQTMKALGEKDNIKFDLESMGVI